MLPERTRDFVRRIVTIDARTLAVFRIGLGLVVLADLVIRASDLGVFYSEDGVLPRTRRLESFGPGMAYSVWDLAAGSEAALAALFCVMAAAALALTAGVATRVAAFVCWIGVVGFLARNPLVNTGGDLLLASLLLWSLFLPLGRRASVMHLFRRCAPDPEAPPPASVATFAILFQIAGMMGMSGGAKLLDEAWRAGDGVYYALTAELYATGLAHAVREARWLVTALNWIVIAFELLGPVLLFLPWKNQRWRLAYGLGVIGMNLGFWLCLRVGIFSWAAICGGVLFVPGLVWDRLGWRPRGDARAGAPDLPRPVAGVAAALFAVMLYGNTHPRIRALVPNAIDDVVQAIGLNQRGWSMFAPTAKDHGWFVFAATTAAGRRIDLYEGGAPLTEARPPLISADFPTYRWRKYLYHLKNGGPIFRGLLVQYLCRSWNRTHRGEDRVTRLEIVYWREETLPDYRTTPPERRVLVRGDCPPDSFQQ